MRMCGPSVFEISTSRTPQVNVKMAWASLKNLLTGITNALKVRMRRACKPLIDTLDTLQCFEEKLRIEYAPCNPIILGLDHMFSGWTQVIKRITPSWSILITWSPCCVELWLCPILWYELLACWNEKWSFYRPVMVSSGTRCDIDKHKKNI